MRGYLTSRRVALNNWRDASDTSLRACPEIHAVSCTPLKKHSGPRYAFHRCINERTHSHELANAAKLALRAGFPTKHHGNYPQRHEPSDMNSIDGSLCSRQRSPGQRELLQCVGRHCRTFFDEAYPRSLHLLSNVAQEHLAQDSQRIVLAMALLQSLRWIVVEASLQRRAALRQYVDVVDATRGTQGPPTGSASFQA